METHHRCALCIGVTLTIGIVVGLTIGIWYANGLRDLAVDFFQAPSRSNTQETINPLAEVQTNPLENVETNPLENVETNPFENVKYNPFE